MRTKQGAVSRARVAKRRMEEQIDEARRQAMSQCPRRERWSGKGRDRAVRACESEAREEKMDAQGVVVQNASERRKNAYAKPDPDSSRSKTHGTI